ncbi:uncharacterized protein LOC118263029 isoform X2 [Spodoptera frugiperda]|uniref:Uncharacterized protein LOC118263029 isoform X2 n=1 Tax=Spodoptera frugiperda TaxID=7108 RepID=A0A9R0DTB0_SPOFR|nr:uncharacterized protein LOC118263029 isoform X2 [Spodoptera frugiperda]
MEFTVIFFLITIIFQNVYDCNGRKYSDTFRLRQAQRRNYRQNEDSDDSEINNRRFNDYPRSKSRRGNWPQTPEEEFRRNGHRHDNVNILRLGSVEIDDSQLDLKHADVKILPLSEEKFVIALLKVPDTVPQRTHSRNSNQYDERRNRRSQSFLNNLQILSQNNNLSAQDTLLQKYAKKYRNYHLEMTKKRIEQLQWENKTPHLEGIVNTALTPQISLKSYLRNFKVTRLEDVVQHYSKLQEETEQNDLINDLTQPEDKANEEIFKLYQPLNYKMRTSNLYENSLSDVPLERLINAHRKLEQEIDRRKTLLEKYSNILTLKSLKEISQSRPIISRPETKKQVVEIKEAEIVHNATEAQTENSTTHPSAIEEKRKIAEEFLSNYKLIAPLFPRKPKKVGKSKKSKSLLGSEDKTEKSVRLRARTDSNEDLHVLRSGTDPTESPPKQHKEEKEKPRPTLMSSPRGIITYAKRRGINEY